LERGCRLSYDTNRPDSAHLERRERMLHCKRIAGAAAALICCVLLSVSALAKPTPLDNWLRLLEPPLPRHPEPPCSCEEAWGGRWSPGYGSIWCGGGSQRADLWWNGYWCCACVPNQFTCESIGMSTERPDCNQGSSPAHVYIAYTLVSCWNCVPDECWPPTPVEGVSWGRVKATYR
jgi:hypothetical protein